MGNTEHASAFDPHDTVQLPLGESIFAEGSTVDGYRLVRRLGEGGMGIVFAAEEIDGGRPVAVKVMRREALSSPTQRGRFEREAKVTAGLVCDHVARVYHVGEADSQPYLVMELLDGEPLADYLARGEKVPLPAALRIARDICRGLAAAHAGGLVHRDLAPGNVWVEPSGRAKLLDFGLVHDPDPAAARLTQTGTVMGTPGFIAPEQATGGPVDGRADLFGLGCILYLLVTGAEAFPGATSVEKLMAVRRKQPASPWAANRDLPEPVAHLIADLLAKNPADRPRTAAEVAERLSGLLANLSSARPAPPTPPAPGPSPLRGYAITAVIAAALTAGLFYLLLAFGLLR